MVIINQTQPSSEPVQVHPILAPHSQNHQTQTQTSMKVVILGEGGSGKTTYARRLRTGEFEHKHVVTLGVEVHPFKVQFPLQKYNLWDTSGTDGFMGLGDGYYHAAQGFILFFDLANVNGQFTGINKISKFLDLMKDYMLSQPQPKPSVIFVANKTDLVPTEMASHLGLMLNALIEWVGENSQAYGLGSFSIMTMSVKHDSVDDLKAPLLQM